ncbi:MAG: SMP-30/gluconolactonase/LRE family protein [Deltaproteobacteria bacterium]|nr:SMP-30/gluconolactonase/LRE family protein [Deltaproteobacteria bacterium]MBW2095873.1 SMP-30/gluconolactonase/LRE family protein [Deltaproteobacteria bacterium]
MKKIYAIIVIAAGLLAAGSASVLAGPQIASSEVPLPPSIANLPAIKAEPWVQVDPGPKVFLEGPAFDRQGNLFVSSIFDSRILKITPEKKITTIFTQKGLLPDGIAIHKDGRLFIVCLSGKIITINPDGSNLTYIAARHEGRPKVGNDLVFDSKGNFYVTDWTGNIADPTGGVYRFSADHKTVVPVIRNLATPNGIALSPEGNALWVSETSRNRILRLGLLKDGIGLHPIEGTKIPFRFTGVPGGADSNAVDVEGNVYQCIIFQGRALILSKRGIPIANVLVPGRDEGKHLRSTNVAFKPGTDEVFLTTSGDGGAWIYKFRGLAKGLKLFSHQ